MTASLVDGVDSSAGIRADIEATRARMGDTLEELGARLNPDRLKEQAKEAIHDATIGRVQTMARDTADRAANAGRKMTDVIRDNPIPAAMIVAGIGWMLFGGKRSAAVSTVAETASAAKDRVTETASQAASTVASSASSVASTVSDTARDSRDTVTSAFERSPLAIGAAVLAAGVALGVAFPSTQKEGELFGEARDGVVEKARDLVQEKKEQVEAVAGRVVSEGQTLVASAARAEGLAS